MSFAGHALSAIKSLKANRALRKRNGFLKQNHHPLKTRTGAVYYLKKGTPKEIAANRKRLKLKLEKDRRREKIYFALALIIVAFIAVLLFSSEKIQCFYNAFFSADAW